MPSAITPIRFQDLDALELRTARGGRAVVALHGGQVLSWTPPGGSERIYFSPLATPAQGALRGGVPVCFPQFAACGPLPKHGLVRTRTWACSTQRHGDDYALVTLSCTADAGTRQQWPHDFRIELSIGLEAERLDLELEVNNTGTQAFSFTTALHSYLRVDEVEEARLQGLYGLNYRDMQRDGERLRENGEAVIVEDEVDRLYLGQRKPMLLRDGSRSLGIRHENFPDVVVWNPWEHKARMLTDLPDRDFRRFLCVEAAVVDQPIELAPGESWWGRQTLVAL